MIRTVALALFLFASPALAHDAPNELVGVLVVNGKNEAHHQQIAESDCKRILIGINRARAAGHNYVIPLPDWPNAPAIDAYCVRPNGQIFGPDGPKTFN